MAIWRPPGFGGWSTNPLWAPVYDWTVEHPRVGGAVWRWGIGSDLRLLYDAAAEVGTLPAGSCVLDVPCGGGVALRGLEPGQGIEYVAADISTDMLARTMEAARDRGVAEQVIPRVADVAELPFEDASFDLVLSFTGLHCFPDPARAMVEMLRVLRPGGVLSGSAILNDTGLRHEPLRQVGRLSGLMGPGCTSEEVHRWMSALGISEPVVTTSGAIGYFRGVKA